MKIPFLHNFNKIDRWCLFLILVSPLFPLSTSLWKSYVWDEPYFIVDGYLYLLRFTIWPFSEKSILTSILVALPLFLMPLQLQSDHLNWAHLKYVTEAQMEFLFQNTRSPEMILFFARLSSIFLFMLSAYFIYQWSRKYYGIIAARFSLLLFLFCPLLTSFGGLAVADFPVTCLGLIWIYSISRYFQFPSWKKAILSGILLGLTISIKASGILFVPFFIIFLFLSILRNISFSQKITVIIFQGLLISLLGLFIGIFWFLPTNDPWGFFHSLKYLRIHLNTGHSAFLWGHYSEKGWWYYYIVALLIKTPIPLLLFSLGSFLAIPWKLWKIKWGKRIPVDLFLWIPVIGWLLFSLTNTVNIGIRHILPIYPFFILSSGKFLAQFWRKYSIQSNFMLNLKNIQFWQYRGLSLLLMGWYIFAWIHVYPYDLAYFNELIGGSKRGYKYLVDSNLDWGQDTKNLIRWLKQNQVNKIYYNIYFPEDTSFQGFQRLSWPEKVEEIHGYVAVNATALQGVYFQNKGYNNWLKRKKPIARIGYSIFVYYIP